MLIHTPLHSSLFIHDFYLFFLQRVNESLSSKSEGVGLSGSFGITNNDDVTREGIANALNGGGVARIEFDLSKQPSSSSVNVVRQQGPMTQLIRRHHRHHLLYVFHGPSVYPNHYRR